MYIVQVLNCNIFLRLQCSYCLNEFSQIKMPQCNGWCTVANQNWTRNGINTLIQWTAAWHQGHQRLLSRGSPVGSPSLGPPVHAWGSGGEAGRFWPRAATTQQHRAPTLPPLPTSPNLDASRGSKSEIPANHSSSRLG